MVGNGVGLLVGDPSLAVLIFSLVYTCCATCIVLFDRFILFDFYFIILRCVLVSNLVYVCGILSIDFVLCR